MAGQQLFRCPKSYNSVHLRKEMYGSKPNGYRTVGTFRTAFTFSELAGLDVTGVLDPLSPDRDCILS